MKEEKLFDMMEAAKILMLVVRVYLEKVLFSNIYIVGPQYFH